MKQIPASKFKDRCLALPDRVGEEGIVITKQGRPVAKLNPIGTESAELIGKLKVHVKIKGDLLSTGINWNTKS